MSHENEHPQDRAWYDMTGSQRRLADRFMRDLTHGVEIMESADSVDLRPVTDPTPDYLMATYAASFTDAVQVSEWFARLRHEDTMEDKVKDILGGWNTGDAP